MLKNDNKVAIVTGASSMIGREVIKEFIGKNIQNIAITRNKNNFEQMLKKDGIPIDSVTIVESDIMNLEITKKILDSTIQLHGKKIHILINAAGKFYHKPTLEMEINDFCSALNDNLVSAFSVTKIVLPYMIAQRNGSIINVSSILGIKSLPNTSCIGYGVAKAGLIQMTKLLAAEMAPYNIRVNCVCPGILNPMSDQYDHQHYQEMQTRKNYLDIQPIKRLGQAAEVASAIAFLSGEESSWTTGSILTIDGGMVL